MARKKLNVEKRSVRFYIGDLDVIAQHYPDIPYNAVVREIIHIFAENLRTGQSQPLVYDPANLRLEDLQ